MKVSKSIFSCFLLLTTYYLLLTISLPALQFTDLSEDLKNFQASIYALGYSPSQDYWLIGGSGGSLAEYKYIDEEHQTFVNQSDLVDLAVINCLKWGGSGYWLLGGNNAQLVKYDGTTASHLGGELKNFCRESIKAIGWNNSSQWLIGGEGGRLNRCNSYARNFTDLSTAAGFGSRSIEAIGWNGSYWLIGGGEGKINKYNGEIFEDYSEEIDVGGVNIFTIYSNGEYWLLGGETPRSLVRYDEKTKTTEPLSLCGFEEEPVTTLGWNGEYWLIGGRKGKLNKYDGEKSFTDLSRATDFSLGLLQVDITSIVWGAGYWLIGGEDSLNRYDGQIFIGLSGELITVAGEARALNYGGYWLLGGKPARLCRYEEEFFRDLSPQLVNFSPCAVSAIAWNGEYWLIGGKEGKLNKYDGKEFQDLSARLVNFGSQDITSIDWNGSYWLIGGKSGSLNRIQDYPEIIRETKLVLYNNLFNPTKGEKVTLRYNLSQSTHVKIEIYNLWGELAKSLFDKDQISGEHTLDWFGENTEGDKVASGIYLVYFKTPSFTETRKVCVIK